MPRTCKTVRGPGSSTWILTSPWRAVAMVTDGCQPKSIRVRGTGRAMTDSSSQPPLMSHQHLRPSWRWSGVSARETAHRIAVHASPRTCHARTYVFATYSAKMTLTHTTSYDNRESHDNTVNVLCSILNVIVWYLWTQGTSVNSKKYKLLMLLILVTSHMLCSIQLLKKTFSSKDIWFIPQLLYLVCIRSHSKLLH